MLRHRNINKICWVILAATIALTALFVAAAASGRIEAEGGVAYESRLFDAAKVHTIGIVMDDWEEFLGTCTAEEYSPCTIVIDGERYANVGIRGKGNTSLTQVAAYGNDRYSFKVEFDKYSAGSSYYGLDKLSLNNLISDNTYMKDYLSYTLMAQAGAAAPLCSFVYITVNGEDWGLYLAVEGIEDGFLLRNYGKDHGELYKPDSMSFGGGRGNGAGFKMEDFMQREEEGNADGGGAMSPPEGFPAMPEGFDPAAMLGGGGMTLPEGFSPPSMGDPDAGGDPGAGGGADDDRGGGEFGGMGSSDVRLQYIDDDPDSYPNIFNNAKTAITSTDKARLIASLKQLSEGGDIEEVVDADAVIRYLVAHSFVCNEDSYTGTMVHNYYLYEEDGVLSMLPWDYNLAFGGMGMGGMSGFGGAGGGATSEVNSPIDTPVSGGDISTRPMVAWIFGSEEYAALYHQYYAEFITFFEGGAFEKLMKETVALISPYVQKDPTAFCTYEEFQTGTDILREFCLLRAKSISGQLGGTIPATQEGQSADGSALIDASHITISDMGTFMGGGGTPGGPGAGDGPDTGMGGGADVPGRQGRGERPFGGAPVASGSEAGMNSGETQGGMSMPDGSRPERQAGGGMGGFDPSVMADGSAASTQWLLIGGSVLLLLAGMLFAKKVKH